MKLKKIVSLAMAGVLAVSMLAGCEFGTGSSSSASSEQKPADNLTDGVIAELSEGVTDKVAFTYDASLKGTAEEMVAYYGTSITSADVTKFGLKNDKLPLDATGAAVVNDDDEVTTTQAIYVKTVGDADPTFTLKKIAKAVSESTVVISADPSNVSSATLTLDELPGKGNMLTSAQDIYYAFSYTGKMAVVSVSDDVGYTTGYLVLLSVTRTGSKMDK